MRTVLETDIGGETVSFVQDDCGLCTVGIDINSGHSTIVIERASYDAAQVAYITWVLGYFKATRE